MVAYWSPEVLSNRASFFQCHLFGPSRNSSSLNRTIIVVYGGTTSSVFRTTTVPRYLYTQASFSPPNMHPVLENTYLLKEIFEHLGEEYNKECYDAALVCRAFQNPAQDVLWHELICIRPLLSLLPTFKLEKRSNTWVCLCVFRLFVAFD